MGNSGIFNLNVFYSDLEGGGYASELGNISGDPEFRDGGDGLVPAGNDGKFGTIDDELQLSIDVSNPCIDKADGDFAPARDILGIKRINIANLGQEGLQPPDMGAYEASNKAIVVICFIDESLMNGNPGLVKYYSDPTTYNSDVISYEQYLNSLPEYEIVTACRVPPYPYSPCSGSIDDVLPQGYDEDDYPEGVSIEMCARFPTLNQYKTIFNDLIDYSPEYISLSIDNSGSMERIDLGQDYVDFVNWLKAEYPNATIQDRDFYDQAWVAELENALDALNLN